MSDDSGSQPAGGRRQEQRPRQGCHKGGGAAAPTWGQEPHKLPAKGDRRDQQHNADSDVSQEEKANKEEGWEAGE